MAAHLNASGHVASRVGATVTNAGGRSASASAEIFLSPGVSGTLARSLSSVTPSGVGKVDVKGQKNVQLSSVGVFAAGTVSGASGRSFYVDNSVVSSGNGQSWATAWKNLSNMTGLQAGDTVYISGGSSGNTQTYNIAGEFTSIGGFAEGTSNNPITYKIGQDASHNGTAILNNTAATTQFVFCGNNYVISGDAGDGAQHFRLSNYGALFVLYGWVQNGCSHVRLAYIDTNGAPFGDIQQATFVEIDHNYAFCNQAGLDRCMYAEFVQGTGFDFNKIHHNEIHIPYTSGGIGADGFQIVGGGWSLYNNLVVGFNGGGINHQDGWQSSGGSYIKVYNNTFIDMQNYALFPEGFTVGGTYSHMYIYNNICIMTASNNTQAIAISASDTYPINDVICANNIADGYASPFTFRNPTDTTTAAAWVNCYFYNNIDVNTTGGGNIIDSHVVSANNVSLSSAQASDRFVSYTARSPSNDYHLKSTASDLRDVGTSASSFFTSDKDGVNRPQGSAWDIGPYEYH